MRTSLPPLGSARCSKHDPNRVKRKDFAAEQIRAAPKPKKLMKQPKKQKNNDLAELPGGRAKLSIQVVFQSIADRDGMVQGVMEEGLNGSHERLDELLEKMKKDNKR